MQLNDCGSYKKFNTVCHWCKLVLGVTCEVLNMEEILRLDVLSGRIRGRRCYRLLVSCCQHFYTFLKATNWQLITFLKNCKQQNPKTKTQCATLRISFRECNLGETKLIIWYLILLRPCILLLYLIRVTN